MPSDQQPDILKKLDAVIKETAANISLYTRSPSDFTRNRKLNAAKTIKTTLNMQGNSLNAELLDAFPDMNERMTASAYVQAKGKLKPEVYQHIFYEFNKTMDNPQKMNGYRIFAIDGSDFNPPYSPDSQYVMASGTGRPKKNGEEVKPFCQVHANMMFDLLNRTYQDCILQPRSQANEREAAIQMLKNLQEFGKYIVIMDRGYDGFNMVENCNRLENCYYVIRTKAGEGGIKEIAALPDEECDLEIEFTVTTSRTFYNQWKDEIPHLKHVRHTSHQYKTERSINTKEQQWDFEPRCKVKVRIVKFRINDPGPDKEQWEVLLTNLNRFEFPIPELKKLYHMRWDIETSFRELKYALGGVQFHSKKDEFVQMELYAHFIMFNAVSRSISQVKVPKTNHKHPYAIDFKMACMVVRKHYRFHNTAPPGQLLIELLDYTVPIREGRSDKRNMKPKTAVYFLYRVA